MVVKREEKCRLNIRNSWQKIELFFYSHKGFAFLGLTGLVANSVGAGLGASVTLSSIGLVVGFAVASGTAGGGSGVPTVGSFVGLGVLIVGTLVGLFVAMVGVRVELGAHLTFDLLPLEVLTLLVFLLLLAS